MTRCALCERTDATVVLVPVMDGRSHECLDLQECRRRRRSTGRGVNPPDTRWQGPQGRMDYRYQT